MPTNRIVHYSHQVTKIIIFTIVKQFLSLKTHNLATQPGSCAFPWTSKVSLSISQEEAGKMMNRLRIEHGQMLTTVFGRVGAKNFWTNPPLRICTAQTKTNNKPSLRLKSLKKRRLFHHRVRYLLYLSRIEANLNHRRTRLALKESETKQVNSQTSTRFAAKTVRTFAQCVRAA